MKYLFILACLSCPFIGMTQNRKLEIKQFTVSIPSTWTFDTIPNNSTVFKAKSPLETTSDDFQENMGVRISELEGENLTLELIIRDMESALTKSIQDFHLIERNKIIVGKENAVSFVFTSRPEGYEISQKQVYMLRGDHFYVFTFTAKTSSFSTYLPSFNKIIQSVRFK